jgi:hypothetical protein
MDNERRVADLVRLGAGREAEVFALFASYLRRYRPLRSLDFALVRRWEWICAAARLSEGIEAEREALLRKARPVKARSSST